MSAPPLSLTPSPARCPFYGRHAAPTMRLLVEQYGNQCALVTSSYAPCAMEMAGQLPELARCEWNGTERAGEFAMFQYRSRPRIAADASNYPD